MKLKLSLLLFPLVVVLSSAEAQTLIQYQNVISTSSPTYWYTLGGNGNNSGSGAGGTLTLNETSFATDYFGNAASVLQMNTASADANTTTDIINGGGSGINAAANATGSLVLLFRTSGAESTGAAGANGRDLFRDQTGIAANSNQLRLTMNSDGTDGNSTNQLQLNIGNISGSTVSTSIALNTWYFFALTWDEANNAAEAVTYLGLAGDTSSLIGVNRNAANDAVVGANGTFVLGNFSTTSTTGGFNGGLLDEFATFNTQLSSASINSLYSTLAVPEPSPALYCLIGTTFLFLLQRSRPQTNRLNDDICSHKRQIISA